MSSTSIHRIVAALIADELSVSRQRTILVAELVQWTAELSIDEEGLGVDSLSRLALVSRINEFFHLHEVGAEDYLVINRRLGEWVDIISQSLAIKNERITFRTSGSTGDPKRVTHTMADLRAELVWLAPYLSGVRRIVALVPPHHIYGFLWTVLAADHLGAEVIDGRAMAPSSLARKAEDGDLLVATPFLWSEILKSGHVPKQGRGLTSSAPMPAKLWEDLRAAGLPQMLEIYGASETGGVGMRTAPDAPFTLAPFWRRRGEQLARGDTLIDPQDDLHFESDRTFRPIKRKDGAVQIGGINVFPERVRAALLAVPGIKECAVRTFGPPESQRLKAFIVPDKLFDPAALDQAIASLSAPERPIRLTYGDALPRNSMGKLTDWD